MIALAAPILKLLPQILEPGDKYFASNKGTDFKDEILDLVSSWGSSNGQPKSWAVLEAKVWYASYYQNINTGYLKNVSGASGYNYQYGVNAQGR